MNRISRLLACACLAALAACNSGSLDNGGDDDVDIDAGADGSDAAPTADEWDELLGLREVDYSAALRKASLRLLGDPPPLAEIKFVADAADPKQAYEALVASYLEDPRFARQMLVFWRDALKMGNNGMLESAPVFAAELVVEDRPYTELFTATNGTCPTFDGETSTFTPADCDNGVPVHAGLLTHPGVNAHFVSNMAFRRVRWVQETFDCVAFPAEVTEARDVGGAALYTAPWPFESIAGTVNGGDVDFLDVSAVACANCHATMNHIAPLFGSFDDQGVWYPEIQVTNPTEGLPTTKLTDWLPAGEQTAWRYGYPAADLPALGQAMAADPAIAECAVARVWNWAFGKGDIVDALSIVPDQTIAAQVASFAGNGYRLKQTIYEVFTSDDFVRF